MPKKKELIVIGAGGHAQVVISTARAAGFSVIAIYDDNSALAGTTIMNVPVVGPLHMLSEKPRAPTIIAIGDNDARHRIQAVYRLDWATLVHPFAWVDPTAYVEVGSVIFAGAVVQANARIGSHAIVNTAATVDHDCRIENFAQLAPGVHVAGRVVVGEGAFLGIGCNIIQNIRIGDWSVIGAGAAVIRDIPANVVAVGVPAKVRDGISPHDKREER